MTAQPVNAEVAHLMGAVVISSEDEEPQFTLIAPAVPFHATTRVFDDVMDPKPDGIVHGMLLMTPETTPVDGVTATLNTIGVLGVPNAKMVVGTVAAVDVSFIYATIVTALNGKPLNGATGQKFPNAQQGSR